MLARYRDDHEHNLKDYTSFLIAIMHTENLYQYQTETRRLGKVLKPFPALESQFRLKISTRKSPKHFFQFPLNQASHGKASKTFATKKSRE